MHVSRKVSDHAFFTLSVYPKYTKITSNQLNTQREETLDARIKEIQGAMVPCILERVIEVYPLSQSQAPPCSLQKVLPGALPLPLNSYFLSMSTTSALGQGKYQFSWKVAGRITGEPQRALLSSVCGLTQIHLPFLYTSSFLEPVR